MQFNFAKPLKCVTGRRLKKEKESTGVLLVPKIRRRRNRKVHELGNQEIWSGFSLKLLPLPGFTLLRARGNGT